METITSPHQAKQLSEDIFPVSMQKPTRKCLSRHFSYNILLSTKPKSTVFED